MDQLRHAWGLFVKGDRLYVVDGTENNCLLSPTSRTARHGQGRWTKNATAVTVDAKGAIYIGEVNGANVRKLVNK